MVLKKSMVSKNNYNQKQKTMNQQFDVLKNELLQKCKSASACTGEYKRLLNSSTEAELLQVLYDNLSWCHTNGILSHELFSKFTTEAYLLSGIANTGKENTGFANSGDRNSGYRNSGNSNSGDRNSGYRNSGNSNSGNRNSGDSNSGYRNSGNWNSGDRNSGDSNSGDSNSGDSNSGYRNSGNWNSGDRNSGDSNSGYRNSGAFCTDPDPVLYLFNQPTKMTVKEWEQHEAVQMMNALDPTIWIPANAMSAEEKEQHPKWETTEGYLKTISMHEAWADFWHNLTDKKKKVFLTLPNFDAKIFTEITGIKI
jgi:hypothetical protein